MNKINFKNHKIWDYSLDLLISLTKYAKAETAYSEKHEKFFNNQYKGDYFFVSLRVLMNEF
jgi:hypothetical protein